MPETTGDVPDSLPANDGSSTADAPKKSNKAIEYDDFGLPVKEPRGPAPVHSDDSDAEFTDAVDAIEPKKHEETTEHATSEVGAQNDAPVQTVGEPVEAISEEEEAELDLKEDVKREAKEEVKQDVKEEVSEEAKKDVKDAVQSIETKGNAVDTDLDTSGPPRTVSNARNSILQEAGEDRAPNAVSEFSHQQLAPQKVRVKEEEEDEWQTMPAFAPFDIYNDDNKLVARELLEEDEDDGYGGLGGAGKGYTRVQLDEDAQSATSMDDNTAYLFTKSTTTDLLADDEDARDPLAQMQATKDLLTEGQRIAYVGLARLAMVKMEKDINSMVRTRSTKKQTDVAAEALKMWAQKMMVRLYSHMEVNSSEQIMIEQLAEHGVETGDLTPTLMLNARVKNPAADEESIDASTASPSRPPLSSPTTPNLNETLDEKPLPDYEKHKDDELPEVRTPSQLPDTASLDIDIRWTILCDLFLVLIADSVYDARSRRLLELVGEALEVPWLEICRFEKRVIDALEMQERANKENWDETENMKHREKMARNRRLAMMGLATVGGGLVIGLSAGLLAPVIGAGLAAGFTTIGIGGTSAFLTSAGAAAAITTGATVAGGSIGVKAAHRRTGAVKTFEYRPLHNNKRVNLIVAVSGWMTGKVDDVRLPFSTVDPIMGDIYSVLWEPEMLRSMGDTINILANEALTQGLQQILGSTILVALMSALQAPVVLTKLSYLIDNPWSVSVTRADAAGLILADSLIDRNLGARPVTLVGFSLGSRVVFGALKELARKGAFGLVQNVYIFGAPVIANQDEFLRARAIVSGRFVNGYATNDWILGYLFRATGGGIARVAGLGPVDVEGIENHDVTKHVPGHMSYRAAIPKLLRECGWLVESDEFTEIEDPDPENHEKRQRELINEIEAARVELENKKDTRRFRFFGGKKKLEKKEWETYEKKDLKKDETDTGPADDNLVLFDIDAIRKEVAMLAAEGVEVTELESTLPPMKVDLAAQQNSSEAAPPLRETKSYNDSIGANGKPTSSEPGLTDKTNGKSTNKFDYDYDEFEHGEGNDISMTFDSFPSPRNGESSVSQPIADSHANSPSWPQGSATPERPPLKSANTTPAPVNIEHNAWADEDEFKEKEEITMTFG